MDYRELLDAALAAARAAVEVHRRHLGQVRIEDWSAKGVADFVTHVDREAEERIIALVQSRFPDHAILAEEGTSARVEPPREEGPQARRLGPEWLWIIDPLDGTTNYLHSYPMYAASVAVTFRGEVVAGAVANGATGEEWWAARGTGAWKDGSPIRVSKIERLDQALVGTGFPFKAPDLLPAYLRQFELANRRVAGVRRAGAAALDLCHVASGYFDGFWELLLSPWDVAAGTLIVREAGGIATTLDGQPDTLAGGAILAGNPVIYRALAELLHGT